MKSFFLVLYFVSITCVVNAQKDKFPFFDGTDAMNRKLMQITEDQVEKVRKGNFELEFVDEEGKKINANALIELKSHDFAFGTNLFGLYKMPNDNPAKATALKAIDTLFNTVIICDYWSQNQNKFIGEHNWESPDHGFQAAKELNKQSRYHALIYGFPRWFDGFTEEELWGIIEQRIKNVADRYGDKITEVDVINEFISMLHWPGNPHAKYLKTTNFPDISIPENGERVLKLARKYLPNAKLVVLEANIWSVSNPVYQEIYKYNKSLIKKGADYDYIGCQAHYYAQNGMPFQEGTSQYGPRTFMMDEINKGMEQMAQLGKPIVITEFSPPSRSKTSKNPNQPGLSDEEIAAWETNFYTLMFSKPYVKGVSRWFTVDNIGGKGMDAGVVTEEGTLKPNYFALKKLIKEKWHTKWNGQIHKSKVNFKGFYGTYMVKVEGFKEVTVKLTNSNQQQFIKLERQ